MNTIIFCRVSSRDQEESGYSLPSQEKLLTEYSERKSFTVSKIFSASESASGRKQRQLFDDMLKFVKKEDIKIIICEKVDRLTRNHKDAVTINDWINEDAERQVHFVKENFVLSKDSKSTEKFIWNIKVSVAQYYIDNLKEEVRKGQREKIEQGWTPGKATLGYKSVSLDGKVIHIIDEKASLLVKKMFQLYASGNYSVEKISELMYEEGFRSKKGYKVSVSRIHDYLTNPYYCGKILWKNEIFPGNQEPLIDEETYNKIQKLLHKRDAPKYNIHKFLFKGLLRCHECGGMITWEKHKGIIYGHCNHYRKCGQTVWVKEYEVENQLSVALELLQIKNQRIREWIYKVILESHDNQLKYHKKVMVEITARIDQTNEKIDNLVDMRADGEIDKETYSRKKNKYIEELNNLKSTLAKHNKYEDKFVKLGVKFFEISQKAKEEYQKLKPDRKRMLLRLIYASITLNQGKINSTYTTPFHLLPKAVEATNRSKIGEMKKLPDNIFEPVDKSFPTVQTSLLLAQYSELRRVQDSNL